MAGIKIVDLPALGRDLAATDLLELSLAGGTGSRKITGQEIINASKLNVGTTPIINGTAGRLLFQSTGNTLQQSSSLFWDNAATSLNVIGTNPSVTLNSTSSLTNFSQGFGFSKNGVGIFSFGYTESVSAPRFFIYAATTDRDAIKIYNSTANVAIGNAPSQNTDAGFRLDVNGTARVQGALSVSTGGIFVSGVSTFADTTTFSGSGTGIRCSKISPLINQNISISADWANSTNVTISTITNTPQVLIVQPTANLTLTSGTHDTQRILHTFAPTSGTAVTNALTLNQTINQTGGANGITRGLYVNPTLTTVADFRAIETTAGNVLLGTTSGNVGIGTSSPSTTLHVVGQTTISSSLSISGGFVMTEASNVHTFTAPATNRTIRFITNSQSYSLFSTGNFAIGTTTDAGFRLDVNGTARFTGAVTTPAFTTSSNYLGVVTGLGGGIFGLTANDTLYIWNRRFSTSGDGIVISDFNANGGSNTNLNVLNIGGSFQTSGTCVHNNLAITRTINLASGTQTVRGIYYNPTLTNTTGLTSHFAFHSTSGRVRFEGLPTSPTGLNAGDLWNDAGTLKIV